MIVTALAISFGFWVLCKIVLSYNDTVDDRFAVIAICEKLPPEEQSVLLMKYEAVPFRKHYLNNLFGYPPHYDYGLTEEDF